MQFLVEENGYGIVIFDYFFLLNEVRGRLLRHWTNGLSAVIQDMWQCLASQMSERARFQIKWLGRSCLLLQISLKLQDIGSLVYVLATTTRFQHLIPNIRMAFVWCVLWNFSQILGNNISMTLCITII